MIRLFHIFTLITKININLLPNSKIYIKLISNKVLKFELKVIKKIFNHPISYHYHYHQKNYHYITDYI